MWMMLLAARRCIRLGNGWGRGGQGEGKGFQT